MSQITRCPQCQTRFKVVDDQLRISDGWVRCGKCKSVFDALTHLVQRTDAAAATPSASTAAADRVTVQAPAGVAAGPSGDSADREVAPPPTLSSPMPAVADTAVQASPTAQSPATAAPPVGTPAAAAAVADAVVVTGNSIAVDAHANAPELSVLVFPRRGGFGDSGYVDSSWMSAYEHEAPPQNAPGSAAAKAVAVGATDSAVGDDDRPPALESAWRESIDHRPVSLRNSSVGFSAKDDLAELQAREGRLMEAIADKKSKSATTVIGLNEAGFPQDAVPSRRVLQPAPAPRVDEGEEITPDQADIDTNTPIARDGQALIAINNVANEVATGAVATASPEPPVGAPTDNETLFVAPDVVDRLAGDGKVEPSLAEPPNYVAEMDEAAAAASNAAGAVDEPGFVRQAKRKAFWAQPWVLVVSLLCAVVLLAALLLQVVVAQRDRLAVLHPEWRPALEKVCQLASCQVALPRHLHRVTIDSTTFNPLGARQFKLTVVLRNAADYAVAVPDLELSLNDAAEKLVLRRVLSPAELKAPASLAAHGEWTAVVAIKVAENGDEVVGYRVLAFYP